MSRKTLWHSDHLFIFTELNIRFTQLVALISYAYNFNRCCFLHQEVWHFPSLYSYISFLQCVRAFNHSQSPTKLLQRCVTIEGQTSPWTRDVKMFLQTNQTRNRKQNRSQNKSVHLKSIRINGFHEFPEITSKLRYIRSYILPRTVTFISKYLSDVHRSLHYCSLHFSGTNTKVVSIKS
jgi:hypothetical protein